MLTESHLSLVSRNNSCHNYCLTKQQKACFLTATWILIFTNSSPSRLNSFWTPFASFQNNLVNNEKKSVKLFECSCQPVITFWARQINILPIQLSVGCEWLRTSGLLLSLPFNNHPQCHNAHYSASRQQMSKQTGRGALGRLCFLMTVNAARREDHRASLWRDEKTQQQQNEFTIIIITLS